MNAGEARKLRNESVSGSSQSISGLLPMIYDRIQESAKQGRSSVTRIFDGIRQPISQSQKEAVYNQLVENGYCIEYKPDLTIVSW